MIEILTQDRLSIPAYDPLEDDLFDDLDDYDDEFFTSALHEDHALHIDSWRPRVENFEELPPFDPKSLPSTPKLELKPFPSELKYAYLGLEETFPVIISSKLDSLQESKLLEILTRNKGAIGWNISDIKGINPVTCTHRIYLDEDAKPSRQM